MPELLLVGLPEQEQIVPGDLRPFCRALTLAECAQAPLEGAVAAVVSGESADAVLSAVQALHRRAAEVRIVAVGPGDVVDRLRTLLRIAPDVPIDMEVWATPAADLADRVRELHAAASRVQVNQQRLSGLGGAAAAGRPAPVVRATLDAVLEHAPFGALVVDRELRLLVWNPAASDLLRLESRDVGAPLRSAFITPEPVIAVALGAFGQLTGGPNRVESVVGPDGTHLDISAAPTQLADGREAVLVMVQDATARHRAETARDRLWSHVELIGRVSESLLMAADDDEALRRVSMQVVPTLADWVEIQVYDDRLATERVVAHHRDEALAGLTDQVARALPGGLGPDSPSRRIARGEGPILLERVTTEMLDAYVPDAELRELLGDLGVSSAIAVPLPGRDSVMGSLVLLNRAESPALGDQELAVAVELGRRIGMSLETLQLQRKRRALAEALQLSMLTEPPTPDGAEIVVRYRPAADEAQVGGDWYDSFLQPTGSVVLSVGDVVGHDFRAAAAMGQLRGLLRGIAYAASHSPTEDLRHLDAAIDGLLTGTTATAVVAEVRLADGPGEARELVWSNAGHPPPLVRRADGTVEVLSEEAADLLLGVDPDTERLESRTVLRPGDTLVLYSDGLVEQRGKDVDEGIEELVGLLRSLGDMDLAELCDAVLDRLLPARQEDDVVLVALRLDEQVTPASPRSPR